MNVLYAFQTLRLVSVYGSYRNATMAFMFVASISGLDQILRARNAGIALLKVARRSWNVARLAPHPWQCKKVFQILCH